MARGNVNQRLNGLNPLAYLGVDAYQPSEFLTESGPPGQNDTNFQLGTVWLDITTHTPPSGADIYMLVSLVGNVATWVNFSSGGIITINGDVSFAKGSTIFLTGGTSGAVFTGDGVSTITESFNFLSLPATTSTNGQILINGEPVLHGYGQGNNIFLGSYAGNFTLNSNANANTGLGAGSLGALVSGSCNSGVGDATLQAVTTGSNNCAFGTNTSNGGSAAGFNLVSGSRNILIGALAGDAYTTSESDNILLNNEGVISESNVLRIGAATGTGHYQLSKAFISGINGNTVSSPAFVTINTSTNQLGVAEAPAVINFSARQSADATDATGDGTTYTVVCDTVIQNVGSGYNGGTGVFTAPVTALYYFTCIIDLANLGAAHTIGLINFCGHAFDYNPFNMAQSSSAATSISYNQILPLMAGNGVSLTVAVGSGTKTVTVQGGSGVRGCFFSGFLIG
jgi:hypothetical protein